MVAGQGGWNYPSYYYDCSCKQLGFQSSYAPRWSWCKVHWEGKTNELYVKMVAPSSSSTEFAVEDLKLVLRAVLSVASDPSDTETLTTDQIMQEVDGTKPESPAASSPSTCSPRSDLFFASSHTNAPIQTVTRKKRNGISSLVITVCGVVGPGWRRERKSWHRAVTRG